MRDILFLAFFLILVAFAFMVTRNCHAEEYNFGYDTWICKARSGDWHYYSGTAQTEAAAQDLALQACQANHFVCFPVGCSAVKK